MSPADEDQGLSSRGARRFATTRWSMVLAAGRPDLPDSKRALAGPCGTCWFPLYALANQWRDARARKRGGPQLPISLDLQAGESRYGLEPSHESTAEKIYERHWAMTTLQQALAKLRDEFARRGKLEFFEHLKTYLVA